MSAATGRRNIHIRAGDEEIGEMTTSDNKFLFKN